MSGAARCIGVIPPCGSCDEEGGQADLTREGKEGGGEGMEGGERTRGTSPASAYTLLPWNLMSEDILFCVDVDAESMVEMKVLGPKGRPITRMDSIKQALLLFVNAKLAINPDHRFAFSILGKSATRHLKEFSNDVESAKAAVHSLIASDSAHGLADLTQLFRMADHEAKKSQALGHLLRVILIYCRSSVRPQHQWPIAAKLFTMDAIYLHDKPSPENCPQKVYDVLVDAVEHVSQYEGYILESGHGLSRVLFRHICMLLSHPQQRCMQDELDIPKSVTRKSPQSSADATPSDESISISNQ